MSIIDYYLFTNIVLILQIVIRSQSEKLHFQLPEKLGQGDAVVAAEALDGAECEVAAAGFEQADVRFISLPFF